MTEFFLHSFNTLGHGLVGYIIPFLFVLTIVVFFGGSLPAYKLASKSFGPATTRTWRPSVR